ncbi:acyl-CoA dehydrogenase family protein [Alysiella crassa]|uniref:Acyl-CoA dehydrogenase, short-chain specific n=1 Tax=Alysiella crassa TaxID=153491 RepID=A0A376BVR3_9NEIS|nr:acyl-CoA dehydrogenase family protein [Alysiella crassa]UOP06499.1 acyl-CoA/acyl-ACP dehydrogenase [Alysiella crassa]SSY81030.1 Acyl-CoA dehydrogenase, short-chain specific [Alysiella crassa]
MSQEHLLSQIAQLVQTELTPIVQDIDCKGVYPENFMRKLGEIGGYQSLGTPEQGGNGLGLSTQILAIREVGKVCGATAFSVWCQAACAWYLHKTSNTAAQSRYLADVLQGKVLAGTGMSNTVKHLAGIENHNLQAVATDGGYIVNGVLPWVSNLGDTHIWANTAQTSNGYVMFITGGEREGVSLNPCPEFCALEGTRTFALKFENVFVPHEDVLAQPEQFGDYIKSIKAGFILLQIGIGAGIIDGCLKEIELANVSNGEVNFYLDNQIDELDDRFQAALSKTAKLADEAWAGQTSILETLQTRLAAAELCLDAAQSAALHAGAKGYLMRSPVQRRLREAMFVAIVTPAIKHLKKEISDLEFTGEFSI